MIQEFAHVSLGLLTKGADAGVKTFAGAAKKLAVPVDTVRDGCRSMCHLLSQFARHGARPGTELADRLAAAGFRESSRDVLASVYAHHAAELRARSSPPLPPFAASRTSPTSRGDSTPEPRRGR